MALAKLAVAVMLCATCLAAGSDCSGTDSCTPEADVTSLLQKEQITKYGIARHDHSRAKRTRAKGPGWWGWTGGEADKAQAKCFLSKKSLFTAPSVETLDIIKDGCETIEGLNKVEKDNLKSQACQACLETMQRLDTDKWITPPTEEGTKPEVCVTCASQWESLCIDKNKANQAKLTKAWGQGDHNVKGMNFAQDMLWDLAEVKGDAFQQQHLFMIKLAKTLKKHKVMLYLDFEDHKAGDLVEMYGGREKCFSNPQFLSKMLLLLKTRAEQADHFIHWVGASGDFCLSEQSGGKSEEKFEHPPFATLVKEANGDTDAALCLGGHQSFLVDLCTKCGGKDCAVICPKDE